MEKNFFSRNLWSIVTTIYALLAFMLLVVSCNTSQRITHAENKEPASIRQPHRKEKQERDTTSYKAPETLKYKDDKGVEQTIVKAELDEKTGEYLSVFRLDEVVVTAMAKTVPERNGMVNLDFVVKVPHRLLQQDWQMVINPSLQNGSRVSKIDSIEITGTRYDYVDQRHEFYGKMRRKYEKDLRGSLHGRIDGVFSPKFRDAEKRVADAAYKHYMDSISMPKTGFRLDTIVRHPEDCEYYYTHVVSTKDIDSKLKIWFDARITNLGYDEFKLVKSDTLTFLISSMMQFLDRTPRYIRKTVSRRVTDELSANIQFLVGRAEVIDTLGNNAAEIQKIKDKFLEIHQGNEFVFDSIVFTASCSPEGSMASNAVLAKRRAASLKQFLIPIFQANPMAVDGMIERSVPENWKQCRSEVLKSPYINNAKEIVSIIDSEKDDDRKEARIAADYPADYKSLREKIYPVLRAVDFQFHLARRNMVEDTVVTNEIDYEYAEAIKLMDRRRYKEAMPKLLEYTDWNTAICYMSLGYDQMAYNIIIKEPESSDKNYLMAILSARLNKIEDAVSYFLKSCRMDYHKISRGELDPEISKLIRDYGLQKQLDQIEMESFLQEDTNL